MVNLNPVFFFFGNKVNKNNVKIKKTKVWLEQTFLNHPAGISTKVSNISSVPTPQQGTSVYPCCMANLANPLGERIRKMVLIEVWFWISPARFFHINEYFLSVFFFKTSCPPPG